MIKIKKCAFDRTRDCNHECVAYNENYDTSSSPYICDRMNAFDQSSAFEDVSRSLESVVSALDFINVPQ